ncbi:MAG TPA: CoA transferase [Hellea balneolensis]|uniref:CoA transferase n=1 Tax=Hellea balneolensis TaxID=287478 RepID=A0A7C5R7B3_9PROT|nr:CoA transferase [Hellea balneolensis]
MGPLNGIKVLDLSRVLAGPWAGQVLADMGADVIKVERPDHGDDTRNWGPPFMTNMSGVPTREAAYFHCANRAKRSITIDFALRKGQDIIHELLANTDILIENYKSGTLAKYGLDFETLHQNFPKLIYATITGFGTNGPYKNRAGYDFMIQGMAGLMSVTGEPSSDPQKVGVALTDVLTGLYTSNAILGALYHREHSGLGQHIDIALMDVAVACMANQAQNYLASGIAPKRMGNAHPNLVPYNVFRTSDGHIIIAVGNDKQFAKLAQMMGQKAWAVDPRFKTNAARIKNREQLIGLMRQILRTRRRDDWLSDLHDAGIPCGPINDMADVFADKQVIARGLKVRIPHPELGPVSYVKSPINYSETKQEFNTPAPRLGEHTKEILKEIGYTAKQIDRLKQDGVL